MLVGSQGTVGAQCRLCRHPAQLNRLHCYSLRSRRGHAPPQVGFIEVLRHAAKAAAARVFRMSTVHCAFAMGGGRCFGGGWLEELACGERSRLPPGPTDTYRPPPISDQYAGTAPPACTMPPTFGGVVVPKLQPSVHLTHFSAPPALTMPEATVSQYLQLGPTEAEGQPAGPAPISLHCGRGRAGCNGGVSGWRAGGHLKPALLEGRPQESSHPPSRSLPRCSPMSVWPCH